MSASNWGGAYSVDALRRREGVEPATPSLAGRARRAAPRLPDADLGSPEARVGLAGPVRPCGTSPRRPLPLRRASRRLARRGPDRAHEPVGVEADRLPHPALRAGLRRRDRVPRWTRLFCAAAVVFHFVVFLAFGIAFTRNVVAYSVFFEWSRIIDRLHVPRAAEETTTHLRESLRRARVWIGAAVLLAGSCAVSTHRGRRCADRAPGPAS